MTTQPHLDIGLLLYPSVQQAAVLGITDLLTLAGRLAAQQQGLAANPVRVSHWCITQHDNPPERVFDTQPGATERLTALIIPPTLDTPIDRHLADGLTPWLRAIHAEGTLLGSVCAGTFLLAESGLLDGRKVSIHWALEALFAAQFAPVARDTDQLLIDDADIITASGLMGWTDLSLRLVDRLLGSAAMVATAQMLLIDVPGREQRYYSGFAPRLTHGDPAILKVQHWLQATDALDIALPRLADEANLEERTFLRRFQKATGMTSSEYCQRLRVGRARSILQLGAQSIEQIAWDVGYADPSAFRKVFTRIVGLSPGAYRRRFNRP